jgi:SAM-dependent methyltransferase
MRSIKKIIVNKIRNEVFLTTRLSIFINPVYIIRNGLHKTIAELAPKVKGDILDFGCGSKPYESLFSHADSYVGVDLENTGHDHFDSEIDFYYDGERLPFEDGSFDSVVCFEVLEHVFNIDEILAEINRVLKPNGKLLLTIPFAWDEHEIPFDFARYTSFGIIDLLNKANFKVVDHRKTTTYVLAIFQLILAYIYQFLLPGKSVFMKVLRTLVIFPLNVIAIVFNFFLPKRYEFYCNNVVLVEKI